MLKILQVFIATKHISKNTWCTKVCKIENGTENIENNHNSGKTSA